MGLVEMHTAEGQDIAGPHAQPNGEWFRTCLESLLDGFAIFSAIRDADGRIIDFRYEYVNEAGCRLNHRSREEQLGHTLMDLLPEHGISGLFEAYVSVVETGIPLIKEAVTYEDLYGGGKRLRRAFDFRAIKIDDGFAVAWRDVTAQKETEITLEERTQFLSQILADIQDGLCVLAPDFTIRQVNPTLARWYPHDEDLVGNKCYAMYHGRTEPCENCPSLRTLTTKAAASAVVPKCSADGEQTGWVEVFSFPMCDPETQSITGIIEHVRDITDRRRAEIALHTSEETARALLDATSDAVCLVDMQGTILAANESGALRAHCSLAELIGTNVFDYVPAPLIASRRRLATEVIRTGNPVRFEDSCDGQWWGVSLYPITNEQGMTVQLAAYSRDITEQKHMQERLHHLAFYDHLTGLPNRFMLHDRLSQALSRQKRQQTGVAVLFLDLDHFKDINDTLGHPIGDLVLQQVAQRLCRATRESDTVARMGGDEFILILTDLPQLRNDAEATAQRIQQALSTPLVVQGKTVPMAASIGITLSPIDGTTPEALLKHADVALYRAKGLGRNTYQFYSDSAYPASLSERAKLDRALQHAMTNGDLVLYFQPQYEALQRRVVGVEALLRWRHPELGMIPPLQFLPAIEETDLIDDIGSWVLQTACRQVAAWHAAGMTDLTLAVNISPAQFTRSSLITSVAEALHTSGLKAEALELEIPESLVAHDYDRLTNMIGALRAMGVRIAIDDVGMGHSSIEYVQQCPLSTLKIDGSFIRHIADDTRARMSESLTDNVS
ncbi:MAG TPA: EAL domain-containing protein, partial [Armatimonadota bacterium]|nr:EAL domain-containing protein [Armatimonadota bacterium]